MTTADPPLIGHDEGARQFSVIVEGSRAHLDYVLDGGVMTITHTKVPDAIAGRGIARQLMRTALSAARDVGWKVVPACSYAVAYMAKHAQQPAPEPMEKAHLDALLDEALDESFPASDSPAVGGST